MSEALWDARHKWLIIGARFGIGVPDLEAIDQEGSVEVKYQKMVIAWLKAGNDCNWKKVCEALSHPTVGMQHMARKLNNSQKDKNETTEGWLGCIFHCIHINTSLNHSSTYVLPI